MPLYIDWIRFDRRYAYVNLLNVGWRLIPKAKQEQYPGHAAEIVGAFLCSLV